MPDRRLPSRRTLAMLGLAGVALALVCLAVAPLVMPRDYSLVADTVSKTAGQGVAYGWITKAGFVLVSLAALAIGAAAWPRWGRLGAAAQVAFAACMVAAAFFETRSWRVDAAYDPVEHDRHSDASNMAAAAFVVCVILILRAEAPNPRWRMRLGVLTILATAITPILMTFFRNADGAMERGWFLLAFAWWATTAWRIARPRA